MGTLRVFMLAVAVGFGVLGWAILLVWLAMVTHILISGFLFFASIYAFIYWIHRQS